jgi:hypothetical protein
MRHSILAFAAAAALLHPAPSVAAAPAPKEAVSKAERSAVVAALKKAIRANYPDRARANLIVRQLTRGEQEGRYAVDDPRQLAERLEADLLEAGQDRHLGIQHNPAFAARLMSAAPDGPNPAQEAFLAAQARATNHGLREMRVYPGNIRYLKVESFRSWSGEEGEESMKAYDHAMKFLAGGDSLIVDVRGNGGGFAEAYSYFTSHFVPPNTPLFTSIVRGVKEDEVRATAVLPAGRLTGKPLWVLSDGKVASATEAFLYDVRHRSLGQIVGAKSAGAANHNDHFPLGHGFVASISIGGPAMAITGGNWEKAGVTPHVETPPEVALETAVLQATEKFAASAPPELKRMAEASLERRREELRAAQAKVSTAAKP